MKNRILVIDTGHLFKEKRCSALLEKNYDMQWARSSPEALRADVLKRADLLLLDLDRPYPEGRALLPKIKESNPSLFILGFTERSDLFVFAENAELGAVVEKPINVLALLQLVENLFKRTPEERENYRVLFPSTSDQKSKSEMLRVQREVCAAAYAGWGIND